MTNTNPCPLWCGQDNSHDGDHYAGGTYTAATHGTPRVDDRGAVFPAVSSALVQWPGDPTAVTVHVAGISADGPAAEAWFTTAESVEFAASLVDNIAASIKDEPVALDSESVERLVAAVEVIAQVHHAASSPSPMSPERFREGFVAATNRMVENLRGTLGVDGLGTDAYAGVALELDLPTLPTPGVLTWVSGPNTDEPETVRSTFGIWEKAVPVSHDDPIGRATQVHDKRLGLQVPIARVRHWTPAFVVPARRVGDVRGAHEGMFSFEQRVRRLVADADRLTEQVVQ